MPLGQEACSSQTWNVDIRAWAQEDSGPQEGEGGSSSSGGGGGGGGVRSSMVKFTAVAGRC